MEKDKKGKSKLRIVQSVNDLNEERKKSKRKLEEEGDDAPGIIYENQIPPLPSESKEIQVRKEVKLEVKRILYTPLQILCNFLSESSNSLGYISLRHEFYEYLRYEGRSKVFILDYHIHDIADAMIEEDPNHYIKNFKILCEGGFFEFPRPLSILEGITDGIIYIKGKEGYLNIFHGIYPLKSFLSLHGFIFAVYVHLALYLGKINLSNEETKNENSSVWLWNERISDLHEFIRMSTLTPYLEKYEGGIRLIIFYELKSIW